MRPILALVSIAFFSVLSCGEKKRQQDEVKHSKVLDELVSKEACLSNSEKEEALTAIMNTSDFQEFLHPEVAGRLPIRVVKNDFITQDLVITSNGQRVVIEDSLILPEGNIHKIDVVEINCVLMELKYTVFYPIEAASIAGFARKQGGVWSASVAHVGEVD